MPLQPWPSFNSGRFALIDLRVCTQAYIANDLVRAGVCPMCANRHRAHSRPMDTERHASSERWWLGHAGRACLGIAAGAGAVALADLQGTGMGLSVMFTAFVIYLLCYNACEGIEKPLKE